MKLICPLGTILTSRDFEAVAARTRAQLQCGGNGGIL